MVERPALQLPAGELPVDRHVIERAELALGRVGPQSLVRRQEQEIVVHPNPAMLLFAQFAEDFALVAVDAHGLFEEHVAAGLEDAACGTGVVLRGQQHVDRVAIALVEQGVEVVVHRRDALGRRQRFGRAAVQVAHRDQLGARGPLDRNRVPFGDIAGTQQRYFLLWIAHGVPNQSCAAAGRFASLVLDQLRRLTLQPVAVVRQHPQEARKFRQGRKRPVPRGV